MVIGVKYFLLMLGISFSLFSCSHFQSGQYVKVKPGDTPEILAKTYQVPLWQLRSVNSKNSFKPGEWVLIPLKRGIVGSSYRGPASLEVLAASGEFLWPVPGSMRVTSLYGDRDGRQHDGIDIGGTIGMHIRAIADGEVVYSGNEYGGYGNIVVVAHDHELFSMYAHNHKNYVKKGQRVYKGQVLALLGNTGRSTGPHLHFELRRDGESIDPAVIFGQ